MTPMRYRVNKSKGIRKHIRRQKAAGTYNKADWPWPGKVRKGSGYHAPKRFRTGLPRIDPIIPLDGYKFLTPNYPILALDESGSIGV